MNTETNRKTRGWVVGQYVTKMFHMTFQHVSSIKGEDYDSPFYGMKSQNKKQIKKLDHMISNSYILQGLTVLCSMNDSLIFLD